MSHLPNPDELELRDELRRASGHLVNVRVAALRQVLDLVKSQRTQLDEIDCILTTTHETLPHPAVLPDLARARARATRAER